MWEDYFGKGKIELKSLGNDERIDSSFVSDPGKNYKKTPRYYIDQKSEAFSQAVPTTQESAQANENQLFIKEVSF